MAADPDVALGEGQWFAGSGDDLGLDQVDAGDRLGHGVLDLEPGVDLEEGDRGLAAVGRLTDHELDGADADVADVAGEGEGAVVQPLAGGVVDTGRRGLLDDLLVAALDRALPLTEMDDVAVCVAENLDLDVTTAVDVRLDEDGAVAECRLGLTGRGRDRIGEVGDIVDDPHAPATTARSGLHEGGHRDVGRDLAGGDLDDLGGRDTRVDRGPFGQRPCRPADGSGQGWDRSR